MQTQLIVLGMHRSGTSAVAGVLNLMGAYFSSPELALPADPTNPKGYWERRDVIITNKTVMEKSGATWHNISQFDPFHISQDLQQEFKTHANPIIQSLNQHQQWLLKDPRLCLTLPLWQPLLHQPIILLVYRCPLQIAQSLEKRNHFPLPVGLALWEKYMLQALQYSQNMPRILLNINDLIQNPQQSVKTLYQQLKDHGAQGLFLPSEAVLQDFIQPHYLHQQRSEHLQKQYLTLQQLELMQSFIDKTILNWQTMPAISGNAAAVLKEHDNLAKYQQDIQQLKTALAEKEEQITLLYQNIHKLVHWLCGLYEDVNAVFQSKTWRSGQLLTNIILKLLLRKANGTAQDNIDKLFDEFNDWQELNYPKQEDEKDK